MSKTRKLGRTPDEGVYQLESSVTYEVGSGGDYATLNEAIEAVSKRYPIYKQSGVRVTLQMVAGFGMEEQVLVDGIDLSWITITGVDAVTTIQRSALDTEFEGRFPAFGATNGGFAPVIDQLFDMDTSGLATGRDFLLVIRGSSGFISPNAGCTNAGSRSVTCNQSSRVDARDAILSGAGDRGVSMFRSSVFNADGCDLSNAVRDAIFIDQGSTANIQGADCSGAGENGASVEQGSRLNAQGANLSNALERAIDARNGSVVNAEGTDCSGAGDEGIVSTRGSFVNAENANCSGTGDDGINIFRGSIVNANDASGTLSQTPNTLTSSGIIFQ